MKHTSPYSKPLLGLMILFLFPFSVFSQTYDATGIVFDEDRGTPLVGARLEMRSGKQLGITNSKGRFDVEVNSRQAVLVIKHHTYQDRILDLADYAEIIDMEIGMVSEVRELEEVVGQGRRTRGRADFKNQSIEELEQFGGMQHDLNDHLRNLEGVSGMTEFGKELSLYGGRTADATHYLGHTRIPNLRHLEFGFPGNNSVLNPRLLRSVSIHDNLARGPLNQGNSSALRYDLIEGDPDNLHLDVLLGTSNREVNATGYWDGRTFLASGRWLDPGILGNLGEQFFVELTPKEKREACRAREGVKLDDGINPCQQVDDLIDITSFDAFFSTFKRDTATAAFGRHSAFWLLDTFQVRRDISLDFTQTRLHTVNSGKQNGLAYTYEGLRVYEPGELELGLGLRSQEKRMIWHDTLPPTQSNIDNLDLHNVYPPSGIVQLVQMGNNYERDASLFGSFTWNSEGSLFGARPSYGLELEYHNAQWEFYSRQALNNAFPYLTIERSPDYFTGNALLRLSWDLPRRWSLEGAAGLHALQAEIPMPLASLRLSRPIFEGVTGFTETAMRHSSAIQSREFNNVGAYTTSSLEGKAGLHGDWGDLFQVGATAFSRYYLEPYLPAPDVYWFYEETREADYAWVNGANLIWEARLGHHFGLNMNASVIQGDYYLADGDAIPWEANRSVDLITNMRMLPRRDSLLSIILTYVASNGAPTYSYELGRTSSNVFTRSIQRREQEVSRQRADIRINLDLKSKWKPLETLRFFFQGVNLFAAADDGWSSWLGGENERQRGWTRAVPGGGRLDPVITNGMGFFMLFGVEGSFFL